MLRLQCSYQILHKSVSRTKVVIFGGATGDTGKYIITGDTYLLDQSNHRWTKLEGNQSYSISSLKFSRLHK